MRKLWFVVLMFCAVLSIESVRTQATARESGFRSVLIRDVPHVRQKPDFCGEACTEMFLRKLGHKLDQDYVFDRSGLDPLLGRGCFTRELSRALKNIGFDIGSTWYRFPRTKADASLAAQFKMLHADLQAGVPSIVCMHYDNKPNTTEHFRLILGYDARTDEVIYHEPAVDNGAYRRMKRQTLLKLMPLKYRKNEWTVIRMPLKPKRLKPSRMKSGFTNADFAQHIMELKKKIPNDRFHVIIQKPFVVLGDEPAKTVRRRSVRTVKWAVDHLKKRYFEKDPEEIIDIWLFKDKTSYETNTKKIFGDTPGTPFGYYTRRHRALIMNISTGGGTLVHEIVHPFIESNFSECPSWFNEGLASLYEQCGEKNGTIHGFTNWRLGGLKQAINAKRVPSFKTLMTTTTDEFYNEDPGSNYGQARYLCYYLQQKGLLVKYYRQFRRGVKTDPTGYITLASVLGRDDIEAFQKEWQQYVLKLSR